jgi:hypothetical protein
LASLVAGERPINRHHNSIRKGRVAEQGGSVSKSHPDEIPVAPDQAAGSGGVKIIERQFEIYRDDIDPIDADPGAGTCKVAKAAVDRPTPGVEPQSCIP